MSLLPFVWRLVLIEVFFVLFFYFTFFYIHELLDASMYNRNSLGLVVARLGLYEVEFWVKEAVYQHSDQALVQSFAEVYPFPPADLALVSALEEFSTQKNLLAHEAAAFMRPDEHEYFFITCSVNADFGCYLAMTAVHHDTYQLLAEKDVLLAMTFKPFRSDVVDTVNRARQQGVTVIGISDSPASPLVAGYEHGFVVQTDSPQFFTSTVAAAAPVRRSWIGFGIPASKRVDTST